MENHVYALLEMKCGAREIQNEKEQNIPINPNQNISARFFSSLFLPFSLFSFLLTFEKVPDNLYVADKIEGGAEEEEVEKSEVALDLVFVVDCTGSMGGVIKTVQDNIRSIVQKIILSEKVLFFILKY